MSRMKEARVQDGHKLTITYEPYSFDEKNEPASPVREEDPLAAYLLPNGCIDVDKAEAEFGKHEWPIHLALLWGGVPESENASVSQVYGVPATKDQASEWHLHGHFKQGDPARWGVDPAEVEAFDHFRTYWFDSRLVQIDPHTLEIRPIDQRSLPATTIEECDSMVAGKLLTVEVR